MSAFLRLIRRRLRLAWGLATSTWLAPAVATGVVVFVLVGRLQPWTWPDRAALALAIGVPLAILVAAIAIRLPDLAVARAADRGLTSKDTFAAALEFRDVAGPFGGGIASRADELVANATVADAIPIRVAPRRWLVAAAIAAVAVALVVMQNPQDDVRAERAAAQQSVDQVEEELEPVLEELRNDPANEELAAELESLLEELREADDLETVAELLSEASTEFGSSPLDFVSERAAVEGLERNLTSRPLAGNGSASAASQLGDLGASLEGLDEEQLAALADRLAELAANQSAGQPATAAALNAASVALAAGDLGAAQDALGAAAAANAQASGAVSDQLARLSVGDALAAASANASAANSNQGTGSGQGAGQGAGTGQGAGQGSGQGAGAGAGQGGSGASGQVGGAAGGSGAGQGGQGSPGGIDQARIDTNNDATIVDPEGFNSSEALTLGGTPTGGLGEVVGESDGPTSAGSTRVAVADVVEEYARRATDASARAALAPSQRELVGNYFDILSR